MGAVSLTLACYLRTVAWPLLTTEITIKVSTDVLILAPPPRVIQITLLVKMSGCFCYALCFIGQTLCGLFCGKCCTVMISQMVQLIN